MATKAEHGFWAAGSNLTTLHSKKNLSSSMSNLKNTLPVGPKQKWNRVLVTRIDPCIRPVPGGDSVVRLSLGRRLVNLLPVGQQTKTLTVVGSRTAMVPWFPYKQRHSRGFGIALIFSGGSIRVALLAATIIVDPVSPVLVIFESRPPRPRFPPP